MQQPVMVIWEGSGNVIAFDVLRATEREPGAVEAFFDVVSAGRGDPALEMQLARCRELATQAGPATARALVEAFAAALQASLMLQRAPTPAAEAFVASRLGGQGGHLYGVLPVGADLAAVLERA